MPFTRLLENPGPGIPHASTGETAAKRAASFGSLLDRTISSLGNEDTASLNSTGRDVVKVYLRTLFLPRFHVKFEIPITPHTFVIF